LLPLLTGEGREHHGEMLRAAPDLMAAGRLQAPLDPRRFTLQRVLEAHELIEQRRANGKFRQLVWGILFARVSAAVMSTVRREEWT
jgi:hypothetical protein